MKQGCEERQSEKTSNAFMTKESSVDGSEFTTNTSLLLERKNEKQEGEKEI